MATLPSSAHGTVVRASSIHYYPGGIVAQGGRTAAQNATRLANRIDVCVGFFTHFGGDNAQLSEEMVAANPTILLAPYTKGLEIQGKTARGVSVTLPEHFFAHYTATRSSTTRLHVFRQTGNIYLAQPSDGGSYVDARGFTGTSWESWRAQDGFTDVAAINVLRGGAKFNGVYLDSMSAGPSAFGKTAVHPGTSMEYTSSAWHTLAYAAVGDACLAEAPAGMFVMANGLTHGTRYFASTSSLMDHVDLGLAESWLRDNNSPAGNSGFRTLSQWKNDMNMVIDVDQNGGAIWLVVNMINATAGSSTGLPTITATQYEQWRRFSICSYLIAKGAHTYFEFVANAGTGNMVQPWNEDHPYYHLDIGDPVDYYTTDVDDYANGSGWRRRFADGTAFINPTASPVTFIADRDYFYSTGAAAYSSGATITLLQFSGLLLTSDATLIAPPPDEGDGTSGGGTGGGTGGGGTGSGSDPGDPGEIVDVSFPGDVLGVSWVMKLYDIHGHLITELTEAYNRKLSFELNSIDSCTFSVPLDWEGAGEIQPLKTTVKVWRRVIDAENDIYYADSPDLPCFAGVVANMEMSAASDEMNVTAYCAFWKLQSRFHIDRHNYHQQTASFILWDLIQSTNGAVDIMGIPNEDRTGIIGPFADPYATLWDLYGSWADYDGDPPLFNAHVPRGQNTWQFFDDFLTQNGTPDLTPLYLHREGSRSQLVFNTAVVRGVRPDASTVSLGYRTGANNLDDIQVQISVEPGQMATQVTSQGQSDTDGNKVVYPKAYDDDAIDLLLEFGLYQNWTKYDNVISREELRAFAIDLYSRMSSPITVYTPTISPAFPPYYKVHFDVGDVIELSAAKGTAMNFTAAEQRVYKIELNMSNNNMETTTLTMARDFTSMVPS